MDDTLRKRLAALRATANDRGATEAEAMAAAEKLAQIMRDHGLSDHDVEYEEVSVGLKTKRPTVRTGLLGVIAICTNSAATTKLHWGEPQVVFLGKAPGPQIAEYLHTICDRAIDRAVAEFKQSPEYTRRRTPVTRRAAIQDFTIGMVERLSHRLFLMFEGSINLDEMAKANQIRDARMPLTSTVKVPVKKVRFGSAAASGHSAGRNVQLAAAVNGGRPVRQIGGA